MVMEGWGASLSDMNGNVPLTISIIDAFSPYSNHSASGGTFSPSNPAAVQTNMFEFAKHFGPLLRAWFPGG